MFIRIIILFIILIGFTENLIKADSILIFKDLEIENYIKTVSTPILKAANIDPAAVNFYLVDDPNPNAFVAEGQNVFVFSGLLTFIKSDDELAGILGHEISHITEGHLMQGAILAQKSQLIIFASILAGLIIAATNPSQLGNALVISTIVPNISLYNNNLHFSRTDEMQADKHGMYLLSHTNYSPNGLLIFMQRLQSLDGNPNYQNIWFSTHPLTSTRITFLTGYINELKNYQHKLTVSSSLLRVQVKLNALSLDYSDFIHQYPLNNDINLYGFALANYKNNNFQVAINTMQKLIKKHPHDIYFLELLGDIYYSTNQFKEAYDLYQKIYNYNQNYIIDYKIASAAYNLNTTPMLKESLKHLNIALIKDQTLFTAWQLKAIILSRFNQPYLSKLALAQKYMIMGNVSQAKIYAKEALVGIKPDTSDWILANDILQK